MSRIQDLSSTGFKKKEIPQKSQKFYDDGVRALDLHCQAYPATPFCCQLSFYYNHTTIVHQDGTEHHPREAFVT